MEPRKRWVVLTPTPRVQEWYEALRMGVEAGGGRLILADVPGHEAFMTIPDLVMVTEDATRARDADPNDVVVLMPDLEAAASRSEAMTEGALRAHVNHVSMLMARACDLDQRIVVLGPAQIPSDGRELRLFDAFTVSVPEAAALHPNSDLERALAVALSVFRNGRPPIDVAMPWSPTLLNYPREPVLSSTGAAFDLTGRPRFLMYGPYFGLPAGQWAVKLTFAVDEDGANKRYRLDWGTRDAWVEEHIVPMAPGVYEIELTHEWPAADAAEIRLISLEGCFSGQLTFFGAEVTKRR